MQEALIQYVIMIVFAVLSLVYQRSRKVAFLEMVYMWIVIAFNYSNADYNNYLKIYNLPSLCSDMGFVWMCRLFRALGFSYNGMLAVVAAVCLILVYFACKQYSDKVALTMFLFMLYPFMSAVIQVRNFIVMAVVLYAMKFLDKKYGRRGIVVYEILVLIAAGFHILALVYLMLPFLNKFSVKLNIVFGIIGSGTIFMIFKFAGRYLMRMGEYDQGNMQVQGALAYSLLFAIYMVVGLYLCLKKDNVNCEENVILSRQMIYLFSFNVLLLVNLNYHRIFMNIMPVLNAKYGELFRMKLKRKEFVMLIALIGVMVIRFFMGIESRTHVLQNNYIFDLLK